MATKVRGITFDFQARTVAFEKAIKKVRKETLQTTNRLKDINKKLRLQPNSLILLGTKAKLLKKEVIENSRQIQIYKDRIKDLKRAGEPFDVIARKVKNLQDKVDRNNFALAQTKKRLSEISTSILNRSFVAAGAIAAVATRKFNDFNEGIAKIATIAKNKDIDNLRKQVLKISDATGVASKEVAEGWYQALSAGIKESKDFSTEIRFMTVAAKLAKAGFGEMGSVVKILATTSQNTGLSIDEVSDKFLALQNAGIITTGQIADTFGKILPLANSLGVSLDQVNAVIATFTSQGIDAANSTTLLRALFTAFNKPTSEAAKILKRVSGKSFPEFIKSGKTLGDVISLIAKENANLFESFSNIRAAQGAAAFQTKQFNEQLQIQKDAAGTLDFAFKRQSGILQFQKTLNVLKNSLIEIGQGVSIQLIPVIQNIAKWLKSIDLVAFGQNLAFLLKSILSLKVGIAVIKGLTAALALFNVAASPWLALAGGIAALGTFFGLSNLGGLAPKIANPSSSNTTNNNTIINNNYQSDSDYKSTVKQYDNSKQSFVDEANEGMGGEA